MPTKFVRVRPTWGCIPASSISTTMQWQRSFRHFHVLVRRTVSIILVLLRNVVFGAGMSTLFAFMFSRGNFFKPIVQQTPIEAATVISVVSIMVLAVLTNTLIAISLINETLVVSPAFSKAQKCAVVWWKMTKRLSMHTALSCVAAATFMLYVTPKAPESKCGMYFTTLASLYVVVWGDIHARFMVRTETVRGKKQPSIQQSRFGSVPLWFVIPIVMRDTPGVLCTLLAVGYVHGVLLLLHATHQWHFALLTIVSMLLKFLLHRVIRFAVLKMRRAPSLRVLIVLIATPTLLIETQMRVYQLRLASNTSKVLSILGWALFEIVVRVGKVLYAQQELGRTLLLVSRSSRSQILPESPTSHRRASAETNTSKLARREMLRILQLTETYAEMYAEYIAIGCAYAVFGSFSEHPLFDLQSGSSTTRSSDVTYWLILLFQLAVEVVVDTMACTVEQFMGVKLHHFDQSDWFIVVYLLALAFVNVGLCTGLYLRTDPCC